MHADIVVTIAFYYVQVYSIVCLHLHYKYMYKIELEDIHVFTYDYEQWCDGSSCKSSANVWMHICVVAMAYIDHIKGSQLSSHVPSNGAQSIPPTTFIQFRYTVLYIIIDIWIRHQLPIFYIRLLYGVYWCIEWATFSWRSGPPAGMTIWYFM